MAEIRQVVLTRAKGRCENCGSLLGRHGCEVDHWLSGSGRRKRRESVETVWALCVCCHAARTRNYPVAVFWNLRFQYHCQRHGYGFTPHLTRPS